MDVFLNDTATTGIYPLSLQDALPIWPRQSRPALRLPLVLAESVTISVRLKQASLPTWCFGPATRSPPIPTQSSSLLMAASRSTTAPFSESPDHAHSHYIFRPPSSLRRLDRAGIRRPSVRPLNHQRWQAARRCHCNGGQWSPPSGRPCT